jgi:hypothetical protein
MEAVWQKNLRCGELRVMELAGEEWGGLYRRRPGEAMVRWGGSGGLGKKKKKHVGEHAANTEISLGLPHFIFQSQKFRVYWGLGREWDIYLTIELISHAANRLAYTDWSPESLTS